MSKKPISDNEIVDAALHLDGNPETIRRFYDIWAEKYDQDVVDIAYSGPRIVAGLVDKHAERLRGADRNALRVLDAGCGTGLSGKALHDIGFREIHGCDLSPEMAERAEERGCYKSAVGNVDLMKADAQYERATFDIVISVGVFTLGHVPPEALGVLVDLVRPGGIIALSTRVQYYEESNYRDVAGALIDGGRIRLLEQLSDANYCNDGAGHFWAYQVAR
ncbi:class I SAM-dependent methyltransferase [Nitratireductor sp. XY-223]|uniref:class I SAM-dependent DNA methyltransferase n=1 Tax=Nitratireductor sp. XY-223 TaxID=2561926 RepID=UPI00145B0D85|nr:class I SAM-dependent methyltransferase [Nitratireductor sp. XY-223]